MPIRLLRTDNLDKLRFDLVPESRIRKGSGRLGGTESRIRTGLGRLGGTNYSYAILSHRWRADEVEYIDCFNVHQAQKKHGWAKLKAFCEKARAAGFSHVWMDTCCIDKTSSTELTEAINSMYRWYQLADVCFVYLDDVAVHYIVVVQGLAPYLSNFERRQFRESEWFTRGWTLQELLAPEDLIFYDKSWQAIGTLEAMSFDVAATTKIARSLLIRNRRLSSYSIAQKMSWAAKRQTTKIEDVAYSLLGIFDISIPIIYGEGARAFQRLQRELMNSTQDTSILAWEWPRASLVVSPEIVRSLLAKSPRDFEYSAHFIPPPVHAVQQPFQGFSNQSLTLFAAMRKPIYAPNKVREDPGMGQVVIACSEDDNTKFITLCIQALPDADGLFVVANGPGRLRPMEMISANIGWEMRLLRISDSSFDRSSFWSLEKGSKPRYLLCRVNSDKLILSNTDESHPDLWQSERQCFMLPEDDYHRRKIGALRISDGPWNETCVLDIWPGRIRFRHGVYISRHHYNHPPLMPFYLVRDHTRRKAEIIFWRGRFIKAEMKMSNLLHLKLPEVEISSLSLWQLILDELKSTYDLMRVSKSAVLRILHWIGVVGACVSVLWELYAVFLRYLDLPDMVEAEYRT